MGVIMGLQVGLMNMNIDMGGVEIGVKRCRNGWNDFWIPTARIGINVIQSQ